MNADDRIGWIDLVDVADVPHEDNLFVEKEGLRLLVHHVREQGADRYYVTSSQCPHEDFTMDRCPLRGARLICTEHGWVMDVRTGAVVDVGDEDAHLPTYRAEVREGRVWAKLF